MSHENGLYHGTQHNMIRLNIIWTQLGFRVRSRSSTVFKAVFVGQISIPSAFSSFVFTLCVSGCLSFLSLAVWPSRPCLSAKTLFSYSSIDITWTLVCLRTSLSWREWLLKKNRSIYQYQAQIVCVSAFCCSLCLFYFSSSTLLLPCLTCLKSLTSARANSVVFFLFCQTFLPGMCSHDGTAYHLSLWLVLMVLQISSQKMNIFCFTN